MFETSHLIGLSRLRVGCICLYEYVLTRLKSGKKQYRSWENQLSCAHLIFKPSSELWRWEEKLYLETGALQRLERERWLLTGWDLQCEIYNWILFLLKSLIFVQKLKNWYWRLNQSHFIWNLKTLNNQTYNSLYVQPHMTSYLKSPSPISQKQLQLK